MKYIQFYRYPIIPVIDTTKKQHLLGSDGTQHVDGRLSIRSIRQVAENRIDRMKNVHSGIIAYTIHSGKWCYGSVVYDSQPQLKTV